MTLRTVHLCPFGFRSSDPVVVGTEIDGGTSIAGYTDAVAIDNGGSWQWTLQNATFGGRGDDRRDTTLTWRALNAGLSRGRPAVFLICDRYHQPVGPLATVTHSDGSPFSDSSEYVSPGAEATVAAVLNGQTDGLNATMLNISIASEKPLIGGERFTYVHPDWGPRCAEIVAIYDNDDGTKQIEFQPPIRGGIAIGDPLDFDNPRCVMHRVSQPTNAIDPVSLQTTAQITLVEHMVDPAIAPYA